MTRHRQTAATTSVALGWKAHSGWSALVVLGVTDGRLHVVDRRRIELVEPEATWAKQPYHAAKALACNDEAQDLITRSIEMARQVAARSMHATLTGLRESDHEVVACAVLIPSPMPEWTVDEILAVHFRMHKAEGVLFPDAVVRAARACGLHTVAIPERQLHERAQHTLTTPLSASVKMIATLGASVGPPWGQDQKQAALAALVAWHGRSS